MPALTMSTYVLPVPVTLSLSGQMRVLELLLQLARKNLGQILACFCAQIAIKSGKTISFSGSLMNKLSFGILISPILLVVLVLELFKKFGQFGLKIEQDLVIRYDVYR